MPVKKYIKIAFIEDVSNPANSATSILPLLKNKM